MQNMTSAAFGSTARAVSERAEFIRKTYFNLAVALLVFAGCGNLANLINNRPLSTTFC